MSGLLSLAVIGAVFTGIPTARLAPAIERSTGLLPDDLRVVIRSPVLTVSLAMRVAITIGIAFLMVRKPERLEAFAIVGTAAVFGAIIGWALGTRRRSAVGGELPYWNS
jgi:hypothetical protein